MIWFVLICNITNAQRNCPAAIRSPAGEHRNLQPLLPPPREFIPLEFIQALIRSFPRKRESRDQEFAACGSGSRLPRRRAENRKLRDLAVIGSRAKVSRKA